MTDYDSMSVHDLVCEALALREREQLMGDREPFTDWMQQEIEDALCKAVIREVSVGVIAVPRYGNGEITIDIDEADYVASADDSIEGHHRALIESIKKKVPEGSYYLIPKETP
jgi:hypothetical protein